MLFMAISLHGENKSSIKLKNGRTPLNKSIPPCQHIRGHEFKTLATFLCGNRGDSLPDKE